MDTLPRPERLRRTRLATAKNDPQGMEGTLCPRRSSCLRFQLFRVEMKLRCRSFDDLKSEIGGFALEIVNLQFAVLGVVKLRSSVDEWHARAQHAVDQSSQLGRHSLNGNGSPELSSQSAKLRSKVGIA